MLSIRRSYIQPTEVLGLLLVILLAAFLRLYELDRGHSGLGIYSATSLNTTTSFQNWLFPGIFIDGSIITDKPPVFFWVQGFFLEVFGPSNLGLRLGPALCGISCVFLLYLILRRTYGVMTAFLGALFLAIAPLDVNFSRGVFLEPLTNTLILLSILMLLIAADRRKVRYVYITAILIGIAFMSKLWQGLIPLPGLAIFYIYMRWEPWSKFLQTTVLALAVFTMTAFAWPLLAWLLDSSYGTVMHSENVWDMIFGWNLFDRFGNLQYGSSHDPSWFWFLTGPMQVFLGITFLPLGILGSCFILFDIKKCLARRKGKSNSAIYMGVICLIWLLVSMVGFGGASVRLSSYWASTVPAICAISAVGMVGIIKHRQSYAAWQRALLFVIVIVGLIYMSNAFSHLSDLSSAYKYLTFICLIGALSMPLVLFFKPGFDSINFSTGEMALNKFLWGIFTIILLANLSVTFYSLLNPRDDTLGRIGFDQMPVSFPNRNAEPVNPEIERGRLRGNVITAIVRSEPEYLTKAIKYIYESNGNTQYLVATDSYNTAAKIAYHSADTLPEIPRLPIIPIYSEYQDTWITTLKDLEEISDQGNVKYIMAASGMKILNFEFWTWLNWHADDVTIMTGLPFDGEMRVFKIREDCDVIGHSHPCGLP